MTSEDCADLNLILRVWYLPDEKMKEIDGIYEWWQLWIKKPLETQFGKWGQDNFLSNFWEEIQEREYIFRYKEYKEGKQTLHEWQSVHEELRNKYK